MLCPSLGINYYSRLSSWQASADGTAANALYYCIAREDSRTGSSSSSSRKKSWIGKTHIMRACKKEQRERTAAHSRRVDKRFVTKIDHDHRSLLNCHKLSSHVWSVILWVELHLLWEKVLKHIQLATSFVALVVKVGELFCRRNPNKFCQEEVGLATGNGN